LTGISFRTGLVFTVLLLVLFVPAFGQEGADGTDQTFNAEEFEALKERVSQLEKEISDLAAKDNELRKDVTSNKQSLDSLEAGQSEMNESLKGLEETVKSQGSELDKVAELNERVSNLENKVKKLVGELGRLTGVDNSQEEKLSELEVNYNSLRGKINSLEGELGDLESSLAKLRENTFENEKRLANFEETYKASARRNLLVAASGIVVGLVGLTLFWAS